MTEHPTTIAKCEYCGQGFEYQSLGRPRRFCFTCSPPNIRATKCSRCETVAAVHAETHLCPACLQQRRRGAVRAERWGTGRMLRT